jgi:hypothetical protein
MQGYTHLFQTYKNKIVFICFTSTSMLTNLMNFILILTKYVFSQKLRIHKFPGFFFLNSHYLFVFESVLHEWKKYSLSKGTRYMWQWCMLSAVITLTSNGHRLYWLRIKELVKKSYLAVSGTFLRKRCVILSFISFRERVVSSWVSFHDSYTSHISV